MNKKIIKEEKSKNKIIKLWRHAAATSGQHKIGDDEIFI